MERNAYHEYQKNHSLLEELKHKCKHVALVNFLRPNTASVCDSGSAI